MLCNLLHLKGIKAPLLDETNEVATSLSHKEKKVTKEEDNYKENNTLKTKSQLKNTDQIKNQFNGKKNQLMKKIKAKINSFEDIVKLANQENEIELKYDLERNVKLVNFRNGKIDISFNEKLNKNFIKILTEKLYSWTGERWIISLNKKIGDKTLFEKKMSQKTIKLLKQKKMIILKKLLDAFDDADLINVQKDDN